MACAHRRRHARSRRLLDDLLVAPLQRAVALEEVNGVAMGVAEHLHLDVARRADKALDQHAGIAKGTQGLALAGFERGPEIGRIGDQAHALATTAGHRLDEHRITGLARHPLEKAGLLILAHIARHHRNAGIAHQRLGGVLQAHGTDRRRRRADKDDAGALAGFGETDILGQKAIAGVDRLRAGLPGRLENAVRAEIAVADARFPDCHRLVGHLDVERLLVGGGMDRDNPHAEAMRGAGDAACDLATVGDQDGGEHRAFMSPAPQPGNRGYMAAGRQYSDAITGP